MTRTTRMTKTPLALALLAGAAFATLPVGCGGNNFRGEGQATPTPTPQPPPPPMAPAEDSSAGPRTLSNVSKPGAKATGTPTMTQVGIGTGTTPTITLPSNVQPAIQMPTTESPRFVDNSPANSGTVRVRCPEGVLGRVIGDVCIEVANLHVWSNGTKVFFDTQVDDKACAAAGAAGCAGFKLHESGFTYRGVFGQVFPETSRSKLSSVNIASSLVVVCRGASSDEYFFNPGAAEEARIKQCGTGSRSFFVANAARAGFEGIHRAAVGSAAGEKLLAKAPASGAPTSSPYLSGTLVSLGAAGYVVAP